MGAGKRPVIPGETVREYRAAWVPRRHGEFWRARGFIFRAGSAMNGASNPSLSASPTRVLASAPAVISDQESSASAASECPRTVTELLDLSRAPIESPASLLGSFGELVESPASLLGSFGELGMTGPAPGSFGEAGASAAPGSFGEVDEPSAAPGSFGEAELTSGVEVFSPSLPPRWGRSGWGVRRVASAPDIPPGTHSQGSPTS
jgi:hypothetical protein